MFSAAPTANNSLLSFATGHTMQASSICADSCAKVAFHSKRVRSDIEDGVLCGRSFDLCKLELEFIRKYAHLTSARRDIAAGELIERVDAVFASMHPRQAEPVNGALAPLLSPAPPEPSPVVAQGRPMAATDEDGCGTDLSRPARRFS